MKAFEPCSPNCPGYGPFTTCGVDDHDPIEIQRCDACGRFEDDDAAAVHFVQGLQRGDGFAIECALELLHGHDVEVSA